MCASFRFYALKKYALLWLLPLLLFACKHRARQVYPSVYFWQTDFNITPDNQQRLLKRDIKKIYARFFDVDRESLQQAALPVGDIRFSTSPDSIFRLVPVVFIRNRVFENTGADSLGSLARHILQRIDSMLSTNHIRVADEIQMDCDWTKSTADKYFTFLDSIRLACGQRHWLLSATIRLHQVKFARLTGVPPVDRGMLMFYNMGKAEQLSMANSIYDHSTAKSYLNNFESYPLKLDVALPLFSWVIVYRHGKAVDILQNAGPVMLQQQTALLKKDEHHYIAQKDMYIYSSQVLAGDELKVENITADDCLLAARQLEPYIKTDTLSICLFDFKQRNFFYHDSTLISKVFNSFR